MDLRSDPFKNADRIQLLSRLVTIRTGYGTKVTNATADLAVPLKQRSRHNSDTTEEGLGSATQSQTVNKNSILQVISILENSLIVVGYKQ